MNTTPLPYRLSVRLTMDAGRLLTARARSLGVSPVDLVRSWIVARLDQLQPYKEPELVASDMLGGHDAPGASCGIGHDPDNRLGDSARLPDD